MAYYLSPAGVMVQQLTNAGLPLSGGKVYIYSAGTVTPINSYTDSTGVTLNANPIILNSAGRLPNSIWIASNTAHKMVLKDSTGNTLSTIDSMYGINDPYNLNTTINNLPTGGGTANAQTVTNATPQTALTNGLLQWYIPANTNTGATTLNVDTLGAKNVFRNGAALVGGELQQNLAALLKYDGTQWELINPVILNGTYQTGTGTANTCVITPSPALSAYFTGYWTWFLPANANTGACTLNVNSLGAKNIFARGAALIGGELSTTVPALVVYDGTQFNLLNPQRFASSVTITQTGYASNPTGTLNYEILPDGKTVYCFLTANITGTSNANTMTWTGIPAVLQPVTTKFVLVSVEDNGTWQAGLIKINAASGTWNILKGFGGESTFTTSGVKAVAQIMFSYTLT
jgi:hypothetical protein